MTKLLLYTKYVDDIISAIDKNRLSDLKTSLESLLGMNLKMSIEDDTREVEYLQMKIGRDISDDSLHIRWCQKDYSAKRTIDFNSFHPRKMKNNVVNEYIRSSLKLSSPIHWKTTCNALRITLKNSNYPSNLIENKSSFIMRSLLSTKLKKKKG